ncbi:hypothetical protein BU17DRAFT_88066 [Hysterangium stoloniferum]|nr:hypothetical protein BU17DRAFT_88066 [Hysterangium stoloniferum]
MSTAEEVSVSEKLPRAQKILSLAAHGPSLPKFASPLSPRFRTPSLYRHSNMHPTSLSSPGTGRTQASLDLTKSHWEVRYENWVESLGRQHHMELCSAPTGATSITEPIMHSTLPNVSFNPAIFPRAGSLSRREGDPEITVLIDRDCASRGWSMDKIQRELFLHDMEIRLFFPTPESTPAKRNRAVSVGFRSTRRWEWDWDLKWNIVRSLAFEANKARLESEYDNFLGNDLEALELEMDLWDENAMEIDGDGIL